MRVHQLLPSFTPADAMGQAAVAFAQVLRRLGHFGHIYAGEVAPGYGSLALPSSELKPAPGDLLLYHHGIASPLAGALLHWRCKKGVIFHNITPAHFYAGTQLGQALTSGRAQLAAMAPYVDVAIGVSQFNVNELLAAGFAQAHRVPLFVEPSRFAARHVDSAMTRKLKADTHLMLTVGRVVAHKRIDDVLRLHAEVRRLEPKARLAIVGGYAGGEPSARAVLAQAKRIGGVSFLGRVSHAELVAAYRAADIYVSMSEHEGFGVPLVEAMAADLPVLAFAAAAVPETLGGRGIAFTEKHFAALAELALLPRHDAKLKEKLVQGQHQRLKELSAQAAEAALEHALRPLTPTAKPVRARRTRVAVLVQRFGEEILGGAEAHARQVALRLAEHVDVTVLTSTSTDHLKWDDTLPAGRSKDGRLKVVRFSPAAPRELWRFNRQSAQLFGRAQDALHEEHWLAEQGPRLDGLLSHLSESADEYDAFVFFTYLYAPTAWGLPLVAKKALLVPTAHDEPPFQFDAFRDAFELPHALLCNTPEEEALIRARFPAAARSRVVGVGIDAQPAREERFRRAHGIEGPYLLYVGRMEGGKGLPELTAFHRSLESRFHDAPWLLLAGSGDYAAKGTRIRQLGRISEQDKLDGLAGALAAVVPSRLESLSLLALEAFASGTPVIGHAGSPVVSGLIKRSQAGAVYDSAQGYALAVKQVGAQRPSLSKRAQRFARGFRWDRVIATYLAEIEQIRRRAR
jgi:glycosyltransferase involved in cell wall biosynthesis